MPLPAFREDGWLPSGHHAAEWPEISLRFGGGRGSRREFIMIRNMTELSASLRYVSGWADLLEGLRHHAAETDAALLPTTSAGPLAEIRRVVAEAQEFVEGLAQEASNETGADYHLPVPEERQKVA